MPETNRSGREKSLKDDVVQSSLCISRYHQLSWKQKTWPRAHTQLLINKIRYYRVADIVGSDQVEGGGFPVSMYASSASQFAPSSMLLRTSLYNFEVRSMELNRTTFLYLSPADIFQTVQIAERRYVSRNRDEITGWREPRERSFVWSMVRSYGREFENDTTCWFHFAWREH